MKKTLLVQGLAVLFTLSVWGQQSPAGKAASVDPYPLDANWLAFLTTYGIQPQQSTSGPKPPPGADVQGLPFTPDETLAAVTIAGVPAYLWRHGCGPTAVGMVVGYHDGHGYGMLIPGDADTQTAAVNAAIASQGHYDDYSAPEDSYPNLLLDKSELPAGDEHASNCLGDFMKTSWSHATNYYGWSWSSDITPSYSGYLGLVSHYRHNSQFYFFSSFSWTALLNEVDRNRPMVFLVDSDADGDTDHFVPVFGYNTTGGKNYYGAYNTWDQNLHWYEYRGTAPGAPFGIWGVWTFTVSGPSILDFNASGHTDLLWRNTSSGALSAWALNGSGYQGSINLGAVSDSNWQVAGAADIDGNSYCDILWRNTVSGTMVVWFINAGGVSGTLVPGTVDTGWKIIGLADADGDGKADLFWRNGTSGMLSLWLLNESGVKGSVFVGGVSDLNWKVQGVGDVNGDGKADILWRHSVTGDMSVWFVDETGYTGGMCPGVVDPTNWKIVGFGDADNDGRADIFWRNISDGMCSLWLLSGTGVKGTVYIGGVTDLAWQIKGIGDVNGDGKADILWRHNTSGAMSVWFVTESGLSGSMSPGTVDTGWQTQNHVVFAGGI